MDALENSTVRILCADGKTVGTGFLVASNLVITCAHVIFDAGAMAGDTIQVKFTGRKEISSALVILDFWRGVGKGDVAFLRIEQSPIDMIPFRLGVAEHSRPGNNFRSFGYATAADVNGIIVNGTVDGYLHQHQLVQLQSPQANYGISGAPVFDDQRGVVIGMITKGHTELGRNELTTFATPSELLFEICSEIRPNETSPYLGLEKFTEQTAQLFFGREGLTEKLLNVLRGGCRLLAVFGPSGSGKSSVVRAGLLPALKKSRLPESQKWAQITIRPADNPFDQLQTTDLGLMDVNGFLRTHPEMARVVLFVDQFEELFTLCPEDTRNRFIRDLAAAMENSNLILILAMRDDFFSIFNEKAASLSESDHLKIEKVPATLKRDELVAIIEKPAESVKLELEEGLTDLILKDLAKEEDVRSSMLPLLEFTLRQLWEKRRDGILRHEDYQTIGGVTGSLGIWSDKAYSDVLKEDRLMAEYLLTSLVHLGDEAQNIPDTRKRSTLAEVGYTDIAQRLVKHFADRRLVVTNGEMVELIHDAIINKWDRLKDWIKKDRENLRIKQEISDSARQWEAGNRDENLLTHHGSRQKKALEISRIPKYHLTDVEQDYVSACQKVEGKGRLIRRFALSALIFIPLLVIVWFLWPYLIRERAVPGKWVTIPAGSFVMGMDQAEADINYSECQKGNNDPSTCFTSDDLKKRSGRQTNATLPEYAIMENEVTNAQYQQCVEGGACQFLDGWPYALSNED